MYVRSILLASFIFLFTLNFVQMGPGVDEVCIFVEQSETTESEAFKGKSSPLNNSFVKSFHINDISQNKAIKYYGLRPQAFLEIRHAQVYLLDNSFLC